MSDRVGRIRVQHLEIIARAKAGLPQNEHGGVDEEELIGALVAILPFDVDAARRRQATKMIDAATRPGGGAADGQLFLPGCDPFDWEPDSLIRDAAGYIYERKLAPLEAYEAEAERSRVNVERAVKWSNIKAREAALFAKWAVDELEKGRPRRELNWGNCVTELNYIRRVRRAG